MVSIGITVAVQIFPSSQRWVDGASDAGGPARATAVVRDVRGRYDNPPYTPSEFVLAIVGKGLPKLASQAREARELI